MSSSGGVLYLVSGVGNAGSAEGLLFRELCNLGLGAEEAGVDSAEEKP
jgi:hypothetical protein